MFDSAGMGTLYINDEKARERQIPHTVRFRYSLGKSFDIGCDSASPVTEEYKAGVQFIGGNIEKVVVDLAGERHMDHEAETRIVMKRQ